MRRPNVFILFFCSFITLTLSSTHWSAASDNDLPTLSKPFFDENGTFSVFYSDPNKKPPVTIFVRVLLPVGSDNRIDLPLEAIGGSPAYSDTYRTTFSLPRGTYKYQFFANNGTSDAIKAAGETGLGISEEATFTLDHTVPIKDDNSGGGGCSLTQPNSNNFKVASLFFLISMGFLFLRRKWVKN